MRLICFDMDGVILDSMTQLEDLAVLLIVEKYEISTDKARKLYTQTKGLPIGQQLKRMGLPHPLSINFNSSVVKEYEERHKSIAPSFPLAPNVDLIISSLKETCRVALVSSTSRDIILQCPQIMRLNFDYVGGYSEFRNKEVQIRDAAMVFGIPCHESSVVLFGDTVQDSVYAQTIRISFKKTTCKTLMSDVIDWNTGQ